MAGFMILKLDLVVWRYVGFYDLKRFAMWALYSSACLGLLNLGLGQVPAYVALLNAALLFIGFVGIRVFRRAVYEYETLLDEVAQAKGQESRRTLLVGAGEVGVMAARAFRKSRDQKLNVIGFVDDDPRKRDALIQQMPVLGGVEDLPRLVSEQQIELVVIAIAKISRPQIKRIVDICKEIPVEVRVVPGYGDILQGNISINSIREIKLEDLLGREPVKLDMDSVGKLLTDKVILVTGAGGSIGSELCRQIVEFKPKQLVLFDISESALFEISSELKNCPIIARVGNCADSAKIGAVFERYHPEVVFHAAAYKHVGLMEHNVSEAIDANIFGTYYTAQAAIKHGVSRFVFVSTDKAVNPTTVMGATKRFAELLLASMSSGAFRIGRFGNVLGSSGSVVPIFKKQIAVGGPVTVTDPEMTRYFMTIPEACQLILQAAGSRENADLFVLDMGDPVKIKDLAEDMIRLAGFEPGIDIPIHYTGKIQGEKITEQLYHDGELLGVAGNRRLFLGKLRRDKIALDGLNDRGTESEVRQWLFESIQASS